jgi:inner membrane protein
LTLAPRAQAPEVSLRGGGNRWLPLCLAAGILMVDLLWRLVVGSTGSIAYGLIDVPGHLATVLLALLALVAVSGRPPALQFVTAALVAGIAIDLDHVPGYLGSHLLTTGSSLPRPVTHSLLAVLLLVAIGWSLRGGIRLVFFGVAFGIALHLARDLVTGPGVPLAWPLSDGIVRLPYGLYALAVASAAVVASSKGRLRSTRQRRPIALDASRPLPHSGP